MDILGPEEEERVVCPVRALGYYLDKTKKIRGPSSNLWWSVKNPSWPLSKNALLSFLRDFITKAHSRIQEDILPNCKVKAHDIRVVTTLFTFRHNMSLSSILQSTYWKCKSIFMSYYLGEIETVFENCSTQGPLSVAGMVLGEKALEAFLLSLISSPWRRMSSHGGPWGYYAPGVPTCV